MFVTAVFVWWSIWLSDSHWFGINHIKTSHTGLTDRRPHCSVPKCMLGSKKRSGWYRPLTLNCFNTNTLKTTHSSHMLVCRVMQGERSKVMFVISGISARETPRSCSTTASSLTGRCFHTETSSPISRMEFHSSLATTVAWGLEWLLKEFTTPLKGGGVHQALD